MFSNSCRCLIIFEAVSGELKICPVTRIVESFCKTNILDYQVNNFCFDALGFVEIAVNVL